ncbi:aminoglycoside phosphotransferase family protein [Nonomuraea sp. NBC_00507]|uniref:aminoglycoside phosphotransferase family protein n=1 Tax=Nonomuraea sp. NBC_00507 TaxID=2976002 RepID=UPI002E192A07
MPRATGGGRLTWDDLPAEARAGIERLLGAKVAAAITQPGGFSEGLAARVRLADGRGAFVKAAQSARAPAAASFHRREAAISVRLPARAPVPRMLGTYDDGDWIALAFEEIDGRLPAQPWRADELQRVLETAGKLAALLTPSPIDQASLARPRLGGWQALTARDERDALAVLAPWAVDRLDDLIATEEAAVSPFAGETLLHGDLYPFNVLVSTDRVVVIDWPHAWVGAPYCDVITLLSSARLSGVDPQPLTDAHPLTRHLAPGQIDDLLVLHAGFLFKTAVTAGPTADRHLLDMMIALARASLRWLHERW